jgi:ABC-type cobalamin/Fe3+-siderophores transport system ATPase subunit
VDVDETPQASVGSLWRRWDPHVHLPGTLFNDQFGAMAVAEALDALASCEPAIEAVGVTDYFTTASYRRAVEAQKSGAGVGIKLLFPNVELRLNVPTRAGSGVNVHLLCAPENVDWLDHFVGGLTFTWNDRSFRADEAGLVELGRAFSSDQGLPADAALKTGAQQFKVDFAGLREQYRKDRTAGEHFLVAFSGGQGDGTSGVRVEDGSFTAQRQAMERFAHIIFSGSPEQQTFWLGRAADSVERLNEFYGGVKPCLHGSDAHTAAALGKPALERHTWLKGDPRFDTLRLACLAPETRARVSPDRPGAGEEHGRITNVTIQDRPWFPQGSIPINTGLVAIIGARGSGKTALADLIAVGAGSTDPFHNKASFIYRARALLDGKAVVQWHGADPTHQDFGDPNRYEAPARRVRYLSQQFVERLCASDGVSDELLEEIERVIYNSWPIDERQGAVDFRELLGIILGGARDRQRAELDAIGDLSHEITEQRVLMNSLSSRRDARRVLEQTAKTLDEQIRALTKESGAANAERYGAVGEALAERQEALQSVDRRRTDLKALGTAAEAAEAVTFQRFVESLRTRYPHTGLTDEQWSSFLPGFSGDVSAVLLAALGAADSEYQTILGTRVEADGAATLGDVAPDELTKRTVSELKAEQARLQKLVGLDNQRAAQLTRLQQQATGTRSKISKVGAEITEAGGAGDRATKLTAERALRYESYFNAMLEEEQELERLYAPLREILNAFETAARKLRLSVRRRVDVESWAAEGENLLDLRTAGAFRGAGEMARIARKSLLDAWATGDGQQATEAIQRFSEEYSVALRAHSRAPRNDDKAYREWEQRIARWLYSVEHIRLVYSLEYDGLDVQRLSPGTRGIVLLLLYLAVDQAETDPLIIDQPEENLDPESVYSELVRLFRQASERRQIIMVTHNANLVVNSDVDQILVAHAGSVEEGRLPELTYLSGGLERPDVRKAVCDILEGGTEAFRQRARRLRIDLSGTASTSD